MSEEIKIRIVPTGPRVIDCNASWDDEKQPEERVRALRYGEFVYCSRCRRNNCQDESHKKQPEAKAEAKLLPCPFCGGEAELRQGKTRKRVFGLIDYAEVGCTKCKQISIRQCAPNYPSKEIEYAIRLWNTRHSSSQILDEVLEEFSHHYNLMGPIYKDLEQIINKKRG